jgi:hypothetical protein
MPDLGFAISDSPHRQRLEPKIKLPKLPIQEFPKVQKNCQQTNSTPPPAQLTANDVSIALRYAPTDAPACQNAPPLTKVAANTRKSVINLSRRPGLLII